MKKVIKVVVDLALRNLNKEFDYLLPEEFESEIKVGQIIKVPFGRRKIFAFVTSRPFIRPTIIPTNRETAILPTQPRDGCRPITSNPLSITTEPIERSSSPAIKIMVNPIAITKIEDSDGHVIYEANKTQEIVLQEDVAYLMTDMLHSVVTDGTGHRAHIKGRQVDGKTGTTSDSKDAWFVGYTPDVVTSVWIGEDQPRPMIYKEKDEEGNYIFSEWGGPGKISSSEATQLWGNYMTQAMKNRPNLNFERPNNIVNETIDPVTGKLPNEYAPEAVDEIFREKNVPNEVETLHQPTTKVRIDTATNQIATPLCPEDQVTQFTYQQTTGIRVGPATITTTVELENKDEDQDKTVKRTYKYIFDEGVPVKLIDPEIGIPIQDSSGNYVYQTLPAKQCQEHKANTPGEKIESGAKKFMDNVWNFFNSEDNSN